MSGFIGLFYLDGRPVDHAAMARMTDALAHRGPDDSGMVVRGSVGLGHRMLWVTPESLHEKLPLVGGDERLIVTADARIDNRRELLAQLSVQKRSANVTDSELILAAYQQWGERCTEHLVGDFAFVIWDAGQQKLFCVRDHFGMKPFYYYYRPGQVFVCASEPSALFALPYVPRRLNETRIGDYLTQNFEDKEITFYSGIVRLPQSHQLTVTAERLERQCYWQADVNRQIQLGSHAEYAEAFREVFSEAVRCRLRSYYPVGSTLSGGLDSSSVASMAAKIHAEQGASPIHAFSAIFPERVSVDPRIDEREYMQAVVNNGLFEHHEIRADLLSPVTQAFWQGDEVMPGINMYMDCAFVKSAKSHDVRVILTGHDGDSVVSHGYERLPALARTGRWLTLYHEAGALAQRFSVRRRRVLWRQGIKPMLPADVLAKISQVNSGGVIDADPFELVDSTFAKRIKLSARLAESWANDATRNLSLRHAHWHALNSGLYTYATELLDCVAAQQRVEFRHPFFDKRLIDFSLALPLEQKLRNGWPRAILRAAMRDILPDSVCNRLSKAYLSSNFNLGLLEHERTTLDHFVQADPSRIEPYVNIPRLVQTYERYTSAPLVHSSAAIQSNMAVMLARWLQHSGLY